MNNCTNCSDIKNGSIILTDKSGENCAVCGRAIAREMKPPLLPQQAAENMMTLSEEQSRLADEATELEIAENLFLHAHKEKYGSDKATSAAWKVTEEGIQQIRTENRLKTLKSELSVLKNFLRHSENVARNLY